MGTGSVTVSAWVNLLTNDPNDYQTLAGKKTWGNNEAAGYILQTYNTSPNKWSFVIGDNTNSAVIGAHSAHPDVTTGWTHVAGVRDTATQEIRLYINGVLEATQDASGVGNIDTSASAAIAALDSSRFADGLLDDVRIYNRVLNEEEIKFLSSPCNNPGHLPGTMLYNQDHAVLQYCNGENWIGIGK